MTEQKLTELMQHISPRYTEEAAARAAKAKPRFSLMGAAGVLAGAAMCAAVIGGVIYASRQNLPVETASSAVTDTVSEQTTAVPASTETTASAVSEAAKKAVTQLAETEIAEVPAESVSTSAAVSPAQITVTAPAQTTAAPVRIKQTSAAAETAASTSLLPYRHTEAKSESTAAQTTAASTEEQTSSTTTEAAPAEVVYQLGDVDGDGYLTYADVMLLSLKWNMVASGADKDAYVIYPQALTAEQIERGNIDKSPSTYYEGMKLRYDSPDEIPIDGIDVAYLTNYVSYVMRGNAVSLQDYLADYDNHVQDALTEMESGQTSGVTSADVYSYLEQHPENICKPCELDDSIIAGGDYTAFVNRIQMIVSHYALDICMQYGNTRVSTNQTYPVITSEQFDAFAAYLREVCIARYEALGE